MITEKQFKNFMSYVSNHESDAYFAGYRRGLRRFYHGEEFGTQDEHEYWIKRDGEHGTGYRDGFAGNIPRGMHGNVGNQHAAKTEQHDAVIYIRCTKKQKEIFSSVAHAKGKKLSAWALCVMEEVAKYE